MPEKERRTERERKIVVGIHTDSRMKPIYKSLAAIEGVSISELFIRAMDVTIHKAIKEGKVAEGLMHGWNEYAQERGLGVEVEE